MRRMALAVLLILLAAMASPVRAESNPSDVAADFNNDGFADLAVGVPAENGVGAVNVLYGTAAGLSGAGGQLFSQVGGAVEGATGSALPWPPGTSTTTALRIWPSAPPARPSATRVARVR